MPEFIIEEGIEVFVLVYAVLFVASLIRAHFDVNKIKDYMGYGLAVAIGSVTPFCFCAALPLFIGFVEAGIPVQIAMTFLIASPLINETAIALLMLHKAWITLAIYVSAGAIISIAGGHFCKRFKIMQTASAPVCTCGKCGSGNCAAGMSKFRYALHYTNQTIKQIGPYILIGLVFAALMQEFIPQEFFVKYLGGQNPFSVLIAATAGIFIYADHDSILPIVQTLLTKGVPLGTAIVIMMSTTTISLPKIIVLNKLLGTKLMALFMLYLFLAFILVGYIL